ncbi:COesterase domain-containing protein [Aphelenchoides bicaudatus]|nr:COesterase domain-containing protein [Aphelenchoides bicaudatus]
MFKHAFILLLIFKLFNAIEIEVSNGRLEGKTIFMDHQRLHSFKRIPFAQAPLGQLRFQMPQPPLNWTGVWNATEYGDSCMKKKDCPVFIMIHGGAFVFGNSIQYNDTQIFYKYVKHDIIFVLPAMRLGFFGFADFGHDYDDAPYNIWLLFSNTFNVKFTTLAVILEKVTLMGYSSGATSIEYLMSSPMLQDHQLFSRVMLSSGFPSFYPGRSRNLTDIFLNLANCSRDAETNRTLTIQEKLQCLRKKPAEVLNEYTIQLKPSMQHHGPQSSLRLMPTWNYIQMASRRKPIPLLVITSRDEMGTLYEPDKTVRHACHEYLNILNLYQKASIDACEERYNDTYTLSRDFYHVTVVMECKLNSGSGWPFDSNVKERKGPKIDKPSHPCYIGIFGQIDHTTHASDMLYLVGQHLLKYTNQSTLNDVLMDKYYPQFTRNFIRGEQPSEDWLPANDKGQNYMYLDFEVLSSNKSEQIWPKFHQHKWFNEEAVEFFLEYLPTIEQNASQFNPKPKKTIEFNKRIGFVEMAARNESDEEQQ